MISVMTSIVTYGASVWAHKAKQVRPRQKLNAARRGVFITLTGAYRTTSAEALQVIAGVLPMDLEVLRVAAEYCLRRGMTEKLEELLSARPTTKQHISELIYTISGSGDGSPQLRGEMCIAFCRISGKG
ncbi:hypothetical protein Trydic_g15997 [Trypoxylus dichotomus]